jgi:hypothetical protein
MPVSINNTTLTFNDASTQTTSAVTSVSAGTGISVAGGKTPTVTNTGVTSIVAGTGITISGGTGAVTVNASGGGVTSLNGQTGAITNTNFEAIGSYIGACNGITASGSGVTTNCNATLSGANLRYNVGNGINARFESQSNGNVNLNFPGGGSASTGTWRAMSKCDVTRSYNSEDNNTFATWTTGLLVRIS